MITSGSALMRLIPADLGVDIRGLLDRHDAAAGLVHLVDLHPFQGVEGVHHPGVLARPGDHQNS
jgi:hypothetical protein